MQKVFIEVRVPTLEDAEAFHDAIREFVREYTENVNPHVEVFDSGVLDE